jgi:hypothetical protein
MLSNEANDELHAQIEQQIDRLARIAKARKRTEESRAVLKCYADSAAAIARSRAAFALDDQNRVDGARRVLASGRFKWFGPHVVGEK